MSKSSSVGTMIDEKGNSWEPKPLSELGIRKPWFEDKWDPFPFEQNPENEIAGAYVQVGDLVEALQNSLAMASCLDASDIRANVRCLQKVKQKLETALGWVEKTLAVLDMPEVSANG